MWLCCCQINVKTIQATAIIVKRSSKFYEFGLCFIQWGWLKLVGRYVNCGADGVACLAGGAEHWSFWPIAWTVWHIMEWQVWLSLSVSMVWLLSQFGINPFVRIWLDWPRKWNIAGAMSLITFVASMDVLDGTWEFCNPQTICWHHRRESCSDDTRYSGTHCTNCGW